jgi:hypothetical protein
MFLPMALFDEKPEVKYLVTLSLLMRDHISRLLAVSPARHVSSLPDDSAGVDTLAGLAGIGHTILKYK